jgi:hypothetical protein
LFCTIAAAPDVVVWFAVLFACDADPDTAFCAATGGLIKPKHATVAVISNFFMIFLRHGGV